MSDKGAGESHDSPEEPAKLRVSNPFKAERTGECGACHKTIRTGDRAVLVSRGERKTALHSACAEKDPRIRPLMRNLSLDEVVGD